MLSTTPFMIIEVGATFFLAGMVKGVTGMGLPTVAMGVLGTLLSPVTAAALLVVPSLVTNIWQLLAGPNFAALARRLWPMMVAIVVGTVSGTALLASGDTRLTTCALGAALVLYAGYTLLARQILIQPDTKCGFRFLSAFRPGRLLEEREYSLFLPCLTFNL